MADGRSGYRTTESNKNIKLARPTITRENILCFIEHFRKLNTNKLEHRRRLIDSFVNAIFLYDDKMVITFNYKEQSKTITFADLEESVLGSDNTALAAPNRTRTCDTCRSKT